MRAVRASDTRTPSIALSGFSGLEDPGPGASVARALQSGWSGRLALSGWVYGTTSGGTWLPGIVERLEVLPALTVADEDFLEAVLEAHARTPVDALIPGESDVAVISRLADRLGERGIRTLLPPFHRLEALRRVNLPKFLHERQMPSPLTLTVRDVQDVPPLADRIGYPLYVRGVHVGEKLVFSAQQALREAKLLNGTKQPGVMLQYQVTGDRYSVGLVADRNGVCRAAVVVKLIAWNGEGRAVTGTVVDLPHVEQFAREVVEAAEWRGPLTLELVQPFGYAQPLICDVMCHLPWWCQVSHWAGSNLAVVLLEEILRGKSRKVMRPRPGTMFVRGVTEASVALDDLLHLKHHGRVDRLARVNGQRHDVPGITQGKKDLVVAVTGTSTFDVINPGLGVARALRQAPGIGRIYGLAYGTLESGAYQPALFDEVFRLPDSGDVELMGNRIEEIHRNHPLDVLVPCLDGELPLFIRLKKRLDKLGIRTLLPDAKAFDVRSKRQLFSGKFNADWGEFSIPESRFARSDADTVKALEAVGLPAVVKGPLFLCYPVQSTKEARWAWHQLAYWGWREAIVQRKINGPFYAVSAVCDRNHRAIAMLTIKKLMTCQRGSTWSAIRVEEKQLEADFARFLQTIKWTGPVEGEFVRDEVTDRFYLIEVNPRFTGWIYFSAALGCNQPEIAVRAALGEPIEPPTVSERVAFMRQTTEFPLRPGQLASLATRGHLRHG